MPAKIIEFEGLDCSFKETNSKALKQSLEERGYDVHLFSFPNYGSPSCEYVEKFLHNGFDFDVKDLTNYSICLFYAWDRYFTYLTDIKQIYDNGNENTIIIFDRWVNSNFYQLGRSEMFDGDIGKEQLYVIDSFVKWLHQIEHGALKLPRANQIIFMRTPYDMSKKIIANKVDKDVNERDETLMKRVYKINDIIFRNNKSVMVVDTCTADGRVRSRESLASEILARVLSVL